jgi:hypothetical protein
MLTLWFALTIGSLAYVIYDLSTNTPATFVMKLAWVLVVLYTGPIGLFIYLISCRQPLPNTHDAFIKPTWKQAVGSLMHCMAGDATGIIIAAAIVYHFGLPNGIDLILEYGAGFISGLFIFQALFMLPMYHGNYFKAVKKTFFPEFVSMNMLMTGMFPTMLILMHLIPDGDNPYKLPFYGIMSAAIIIGGLVAYPINYWMVNKGVKHGMMSVGAKMEHKMAPSLSLQFQISIIFLTLAILFFALWLTSFFAPISFS